MLNFRQLLPPHSSLTKLTSLSNRNFNQLKTSRALLKKSQSSSKKRNYKRKDFRSKNPETSQHKNVSESSFDFSTIKKLPYRYTDFLKLLGDNTFFAGVACVVSKKTRRTLSSSPSWVSDYEYRNSEFTFRIVDKDQIKNLKLSKTALEHFYYDEFPSPSLYDTRKTSNETSKITDPSSQNLKDLISIITSSTPTTMSPIEHLIKLLIYSDLSTLINNLKILKPSTMLLLAGSLGKGLAKPGSDLDLVLIDSNFVRPNESYNYFMSYWSMFGREESEAVLGRLSRVGKLEMILQNPNKQNVQRGGAGDLITEYNYLPDPTFPLVKFNFCQIPIDIQAGNFTALDEVSITRYLILKYNQNFISLNNYLIIWAKHNDLLARDWSSRKFKSFHFTSLLFFYCVKEGYFASIFECIDQELFIGQGIVMLSENSTDKAFEKLQPLKIIPSCPAEQQKILKNFINFMADFNYYDKIDLLENTIEKRFDDYDDSALYSMTNFVSKYEMSGMFLSGKKSKVMNSQLEAGNLKKNFERFKQIN